MHIRWNRCYASFFVGGSPDGRRNRLRLAEQAGRARPVDRRESWGAARMSVRLGRDQAPSRKVGRQMERSEGRLEMSPQGIEKVQFGDGYGATKGGMKPSNKTRRGSIGAGSAGKTVSLSAPSAVMAGLVPAIHAVAQQESPQNLVPASARYCNYRTLVSSAEYSRPLVCRTAWMAGTSPAMTRSPWPGNLPRSSRNRGKFPGGRGGVKRRKV